MVPAERLVWLILNILLLLLARSSDGGSTLTRIVQTRYGKLQGFINTMNPARSLKPIEVFLGVPYATPPIGPNRFAPTRAAMPWDGVRLSTTPGPACPQRLPDLSNETEALERMPKGRLESLRRLIPLLGNQSEDCLYLNIFAPIQTAPRDKTIRYPVLIFLHGESFEWNSATPYDGSVLTSYSDLVVVTINYRLGILGFLNANVAPNASPRVANYGLMDQLAALHWVQQNIALFGGDPRNVTLAGHSTGAACINFLIISPTVMPGLFHRAILLSGSALSSWALVEDPVSYAVSLARQVNCSVPEDLLRDNEDIVDCLRDVPLQRLLSADVTAPSYLSAFGPSVDGVVIRTDFREELLINYLPDFPGLTGASVLNYKRGENMFGRNKYDLMLGVVTGESLPRFPTDDIKSGFGSERRDKILRTYVRNAYTYHLSEILSTVVNEYTDWERTVVHPINTRDATVAALSDAQYVAPLVLTGDLLSQPPPSVGDHREDMTTRSFFYVFDYQTKEGDYPQKLGTAHGEELPYFFGAPLVDGFAHFPKNYTKTEVALSESVIIYFSNFVRSGSPNAFHKQEVSLAVSKERNRFRTITWDEYDPVHQKYLEISMKPRIKNHYRAHQLSVWLRLVPELHRAGMEDVVARHNLFRNHDDLRLYDGVVRPDPLRRLQDIRSRGNLTVAEVILPMTTTDPPLTTCMTVHHPHNNSETITHLEAAGYAAYSTAFNVTVAVGCSLLILNVLIFAGVYYQRDKTKLEMKSLQQQKSFNFDSMGKFHHASSASVIVDIERDASTIIFADGTLPRSGSPGAKSLARLHLVKPSIASNIHPNHASTLPRNTTFKSMDLVGPPNGSVTLPKTPPPKSRTISDTSSSLNPPCSLASNTVNTIKVPAAAISEMIG
ncbi:neuroligin-4, Y-linked-like [Macrosteles quadrilineatus]|uniref:neuroligin-4, Y-linked-like n=1 Tax=Macrosteles quadrilineatus TaxID=74068 RepID=UPI0023E0FA42|nr:neuroligin-4, Y-linked-like [Macrosteles quadrilineatus]